MNDTWRVRYDSRLDRRPLNRPSSARTALDLLRRDQGIATPPQPGALRVPPPDLSMVRALARALKPTDMAEEGVERATFVRAGAGARTACGDFCDAFALNDYSVALVVGEVSGQGEAAAAHVPELRAMTRVLLYSDPDPGRALTGVNRALCFAGQANSTPLWLTRMSIAVVYPKVGVAAFACAGGEPPMIVSTRAIHSSIPVAGLPLGACEDTAYIVVQRPLSLSDLIVMATAGISEAGRPHRPLGTERFVKWINGLVQIGSLRTMGQMLMDEVESYSRGTRPADAALLLARLI